MDLHDFTFEFHLYTCVECILMKAKCEVENFVDNELSAKSTIMFLEN